MVLRETAAQCSSPSAACLCSKTIRLLLHEVTPRAAISEPTKCARECGPHVKHLYLFSIPPLQLPAAALQFTRTTKGQTTNSEKNLNSDHSTCTCRRVLTNTSPC